MAPILYIIFISIFVCLLVSAIVAFLLVWMKSMNKLGEKSRKILLKPKSYYERMAEDQEATEQFIYMRRKFFGG